MLPTSFSRCFAPAKNQVRTSSRSRSMNLGAVNSTCLKILLFLSFHSDQITNSTRVWSPLRCWLLPVVKSVNHVADLGQLSNHQEKLMGNLPRSPPHSTPVWRMGTRLLGGKRSPGFDSTEGKSMNWATHAGAADLLSKFYFVEVATKKNLHLLGPQGFQIPFETGDLTVPCSCSS